MVRLGVAIDNADGVRTMDGVRISGGGGRCTGAEGDDDLVAERVGHGEQAVPAPACQVAGPELAAGQSSFMPSGRAN